MCCKEVEQELDACNGFLNHGTVGDLEEMIQEKMK